MLQRLGSEPVFGVDFSAVSILRLDQLDKLAPGNKRFKLRRVFDRAALEGAERILSFGGAWSNHLHALAAVGHERGVATVGFVRGEQPARLSATLEEAADWGMQLHFLSRSEYRRRNAPDWQRALVSRFERSLLVPEGGADLDGLLGAVDITRLLPSRTLPRTVLVAVGTGTTLAGLALGLAAGDRVLGVSALRGAVDLEKRVQQLLATAAVDCQADWAICHDYHCGGFARVNPQLKAFMLAFEKQQAVPLEPVYTGKLLFAIHGMLARGELESGRELIAIHTGGLQGRRGYAWLGG